MFFIINGKIRAGPRRRERTIYGNGNALGQLVSICSHERWDFSELVEFQILGTERPLGSIGVDNFEVKLVFFGNGSNGRGTCVSLQRPC